MRSQRAVRLLEQLGYRDVAHFVGGITAWRRAGLPMEEGEERQLRPEERGGPSPLHP